MADRRLLLGATGALAVALIVWAAIRAPTDSSPPEAPRGEGAGDLRGALERESSARLALAKEVDRLRAELEGFRSSFLAQRPPDDPAAGSGATPGTAPPAAEMPAVSAAPSAFDEARLISVGVTPTEVGRLREHWEARHLARLNLAHAAARGGWIDEKRYVVEVGDVERRLQQEMGDESYDLLLYASGEVNRVTVTDVLGSSPAQLAGLQVDDVILRYGEQALFSPRELVRLSREATLGTTVPLVVVRNGEELRVLVPGGPLGVVIAGTKGRP